MRSFKHQIFIVLLGSLVILAGSFLVVLSWDMQERDVAAAIVKAQADLAICEEIIDTKYPGSWSVRDGELYKGLIKISFNNDIVEHLARLTGDTVTVFLGETRVATTVLGSNKERVIGTKVSANVAQTVLQNGQTYLGVADVVGQRYQAAYSPLRAESGNIIGMFYVGVSHAYEQQFITGSLTTMAALGLALTLLVALLAWFLLQKVILYPLHNVSLGNQEVVPRHFAQRIEVFSAKEIEGLEDAFNQRAEQIQALTGEFNRATRSNLKNDPPESEIHTVEEQVKISEPIKELTIVHKETTRSKPPLSFDSPWCSGEGLPKGLNKVTLGHIVQYLQVTRRPLSAEEVAEGVKLTRVTVRHYLEFLEQRGVLKSDLKYGTGGRPVKLFILL